VAESAPSWLQGIVATDDRDATSADARGRIEEMLRTLDHSGIEIEIVLVEGKPADRIVEAARSRGADLLVMGSSGRTGLDRLFLGSVATEVLRRLPCSMITVKSEHIVRPELEAKVQGFEQRFNRGVELSRAGFAEEAIEEFRRCLEDSPMTPHVWLAMARIYERTGNEAEARACENRAREISKMIENERIQADIRREHWLTGAER
jgi:hypothetical protein